MQQQRLISCNQQGKFKLYGREKELQELHDVYRAATIPDHAAQCVFVGGASGTGKSILIQRAFVSENCLYGAGKFPERGQSEPYEALAHVISDICNQAYNRDAAKYKNMLMKELKRQELDTLIDVFPEINVLVDDRSTSEQTTAPSRSKEGLEKLKYSLRLFLRAMCLAEWPVVMCLDDLHWMDTATLNILQSVLGDFELTNLLFVGSYRDNEVTEELTQWMDGMEDATRIMLGDLQLDDIRDMLLDLLRVDNVDDLAQLVLKQTNGNVFHVLHLLDYMQSEGLLEYSLTKFCWTWDIDRLREETSLSDNVVDIVSSRLNRLSPQALRCLRRASSLSFRFDPSVLQEVMDDDSTDTKACLEEAIEEGILERLDENRLKFTHDRIYQAALRLISNEKERQEVHLSMGKILWNEYGLDDPGVWKDLNDRHLFVCIDQLNLGRRQLREDETAFRVQLAGLNCEASKRAASFSAFVPSLEYLQSGLELLDPRCRWEEHGNLTLELFTSMSEMCFCAGRIEECLDAASEVLRHAKSIDDSLRVYLVLIQSQSAQAKYNELVDTSLEVLEKLGEHAPSTPNRFSTKLIFDRTKRSLQAKSDEEILALPKMQNEHKAAAIQVMSDMMWAVDQIGRFNLITLLICRMIRLTFHYGLAPYSALAFALTSQLFVASQNDVDMGCRFARLSIKLLDKLGLDASRTAARVFMHSGFALHWREPLSIIVDYWIDAHQRGMRNGDLNAAVQNITGYGVAYFYSGLPLDPFANDLENFCSLMDNYGQKYMLLANVPVYQCVLNLMGRSDNLLDMSHGKAMEYRNKLGWESRTGEEAEWSFRMQICFYAEEYTLATAFANKVEPLHAGASRALPLYHARVFFFCLIAIHNARETGKRQYKVKATKHYSVVRGWVVKQHAINVVHKLQILDAEMLTLEPKRKKKEDKVAAAFDKAIGTSTKAGFLQDAALAAHLASHAAKEKAESLEYFQTACELYRRWGAYGLAEYLERSSRRHRQSFLHRNSLSSIRSNSSAGSYRASGYRSRERFDSSLTLKHTKLDIDSEETDS